MTQDKAEVRIFPIHKVKTPPKIRTVEDIFRVEVLVTIQDIMLEMHSKGLLQDATQEQVTEYIEQNIQTL